MRKTAIDIIGDVPWGTHFCQFYETKEDLIDILVPYFKAGLENNEFCMWITSEPLNNEDAKRALNKKIKNLDDYIKSGQIEILDYTQWYTKAGHFDANEVLQGWIEKEKQALEKGFEGLRLSGNTFWLENRDWKKFTEYEAAVNSVIGQHQMLAVCTYSLDKCSASEIVDVVSNHQFALVKQQGKWEIIEGAEHKKTIEALRRSDANYRTIFDAANDAIFVHDTENGKILSVNQKTCEMFGYAREELERLTVGDISTGVPPYDQEHALRCIKKAATEGPQLFEWIAKHKTGKEFWIEVNLKLAVIEDQERMLAIVRDITERKETEEALKLHEFRLQALLELNKMVKSSQEEILDFVREEMIKTTQSEFAFIGFMDEDESIMTIDNWSKEAMAQCAVVNEPMHFPIAEAGLWGKVVRQRKAVVVNNYAAHRYKKGYPEGHVPIKRFLGVPVFDLNRIVAVAAVANKEKDYDESDIRAVTSMMNDMWRLIRYKRTEEQIENLARFPSEDPNPVLRVAKDGTLLYANDASRLLLDEWNRKVGQAVPDDWQHTITDVYASGSYQRVEAKYAEQVFAFVVAPMPEADYVNLYGRDITERKEIAARQELAGRILEHLNQKSTRPVVIHEVIKLIKESTGFEAVGVRLHEGEDFPYFEVNGFTKDFVENENYLCSRNEDGEQILDEEGHPVLSCMCGSVIIGRADPDLPFFTEGGSFWTNSTTELQSSASLDTLQVPLRNRCNEAGYESVALIPLRSGDEIVGLLQLNDSRPGRFTLEMVRFFERIGASIGIGLARIKAEENIHNLAKFPSENPSPVLRIAKEGTVLYANAVGSELLKTWECNVGERVPEHWHQYVLRILKSGSNEELEIKSGDRVFSLIMAPIADAGYVNAYGIDITERKLAEEDLRKYRQHLEELVETRTGELTQANRQLLQEIEIRKHLEKEILNISEQERRKIGQELHDSLGQQLTGVAFMTKVLEQKLAKKSLNEAANVAEIAKLVNQATEQARGLAKGLHPVDLDTGTLMSSLQELATSTETLFGIHCTFKCDKRVRVDNPEVAVHLYRITQEAITNAIKHGKAKNILIDLGCDRDKSVLTVRNDGLDFPKEFEARHTGMGLQIMDHRVDIIDGSLDIRKRPKGGTIMTCTFTSKGIND
ncbi:MAG: MEDS domain-containing protein [Planctomycetota bacterium]